MDRGAWWAIYSPWCFKESNTTERLTHTHIKLAKGCINKMLLTLPFKYLRAFTQNNNNKKSVKMKKAN